MTIVVSRYNENIDWIAELNCNVVVYNKGSYLPNTISLPNVGREADSYLRFIIENYNKLDDVTGFLQANPFDHCRDVLDIIKNYECGLKWLGTNWGPVTKNYDGGPGSIPLPLIDICYQLFNIKLTTDVKFTFSAGAQYLVPKQYIKSKSLIWWINCYDIFNQYIDTSPWAYERLWPIIWDYSTNH